MRLLPALLALACLSAQADQDLSGPRTAPSGSSLPPTPVSMPPMHSGAAIDYGILTVSRERLEVATPCDIGIYLNSNLAARLYQGQSATFNLPPGNVLVRLGQLGGNQCQPRFEQLRSENVHLNAGAIVKYRVAMDELGLHLLPAPSDY